MSRSPAPRFHAATGAIRKSLELAFYELRMWYRQAADELEAGKTNVDFGVFSAPGPPCSV